MKNKTKIGLGLVLIMIASGLGYITVTIMQVNETNYSGLEALTYITVINTMLSVFGLMILNVHKKVSVNGNTGTISK